MLMGEYHHTIDEKGRITLPSKSRYELGETFIVTRGLDNCLFVYPKEEWIHTHHAMILFGRFTMPARTKNQDPYSFLPPLN